MAPFQRVNIILGHRTKKTGSLGFSFQTDTDTNDHRVYHVEPFAQPCGIRAGDFIVGLNHQPLSSKQPHTNVAESIKTIRRPFTLNVLRPQDIMVDERPKLRQQHRDWFVAFCRKYRVERSVIEATLRLRRATTCVGQHDKSTVNIPYTGSGRNDENGHDGDMTSLAAKRHLIACLRVMVKFIDDRMGVTSLSALAGFKLSDDQWMALEFELCNQVNWNLVYFCHSSKKSVRASPKSTAVYAEDSDLFALVHQHQHQHRQEESQPASRTVSVEHEIEHYWDAQDHECNINPHRERDFWEPITPPRRGNEEAYKRKRADTITPPTSTSHKNQDPKRRTSNDQTLNPIHRLAKAKAYTQSHALIHENKHSQAQHRPHSAASASSRSSSQGSFSSSHYSSQHQQRNIAVLTLGPSSSGSDTSGSDNENENTSSNNHPSRIIQKIHFSQISHATNTTQEHPQRSNRPSSNSITQYSNSKVAPHAQQYHPHSGYVNSSQHATCIYHDPQTGREVVQIVNNKNHREPSSSYPQQYNQNMHQHKRYAQQMHHQQQQRQHHQQHQHEKSRTSHHTQAQHPGFLTMFRARCQSIVNSINRGVPQVAAP